MTGEMLLSEAQVAMDELLLACNHAVGRCAECADLPQEEAGGLAALLRRAAAEQGEIAATLRETIRRSDHVPKEEEGERELLASLGVQVRAIVSAEREAWVIDACLKSETDLLENVRILSAFDLDAGLESRLEELRESVRRTVEELQDMRLRM
ncbi:MAG: hypothetical protein L0I62_03415 [Gammaproteobacteria bacterium]|nr:hypothetical protein [Gammaproteobacteria bacterium]